MALAEDTAALIKKSGAMATDEVKMNYGASQKIIDSLGVPERALAVGDAAPMFELPDANGELVRFADAQRCGNSLFPPRKSSIPTARSDSRSSIPTIGPGEPTDVVAIATSM